MNGKKEEYKIQTLKVKAFWVCFLRHRLLRYGMIKGMTVIIRDGTDNEKMFEIKIII